MMTTPTPVMSMIARSRALGTPWRLHYAARTRRNAAFLDALHGYHNDPNVELSFNFDQEADDFLSQMGSIVVFSSATKSVRNLRAALGRRITPEEFSDSELPRGVAWMKLPGRDPTKVLAWK